MKKSEENKDKEKQEKNKWFNRFFNKEKLKKTNKVAVVYLRDNGLADFKEVESRDDRFIVEGKTYHVDRDCVYATQKDRIPLMIIREWDLIPIGTKKWDDDDMRSKFSKLESHVINGIKNVELYKSGLQGGSNLTNKQIILYVIIAIVIVAIIINYV